MDWKSWLLLALCIIVALLILYVVGFVAAVKFHFAWWGVLLSVFGATVLMLVALLVCMFFELTRSDAIIGR